MTRNRQGAKTAAKKTTEARVPAARTPHLALTAEAQPTGKVIKGQPVCNLDYDPDTSLGTSLRLHLMSEHNVVEALHFDDDAAERRHQELHAAHCDHDIEDHRFRPGVAYELMQLALREAESVVRFLVPAP